MINFFQKDGFQFCFSDVTNNTPAHVFLIGQGGKILIWLEPLQAALIHNLSLESQSVAVQMVRENIDMIKEKWIEWSDSLSGAGVYLAPRAE